MKDKVVLITGASGGIGRAIALKFAKRGAKLALNDISFAEESLKEFTNQLQRDGVEAQYFLADISNFEDVERMMSAIGDRFGRIDVLVNNAGIVKDRTMAKMTKDEWQKVIDVNLTGAFNVTKTALSLLVPNQGKIVNISSVVGQSGNFGQVNYSAAKAGLLGFTKTLSKELGKLGVTVNAVCPGFIETKLTEDIPDEFKTIVKRLTSLGRFGKPEELANLVVFLGSDEASFITGAIINIDGGLSI